MNYSSSDDSAILQTKKKSRISSKTQREKTGVSNSDSESDSESASVLPNPPDLTINKEIPVKKPSNTLEPIQEVLDLQFIDGSLVSHKSNGKFLFIVLLIIFIILYTFF